MSGYTPELKKLIKKVEATRPARLEKARRNDHFPALTMEQRQEWLGKYHPDYKPDGRREVKIGPNKGDILPDEIVDILESKGVIDPSHVKLDNVDIETDVLVIGAGGAGTAAAIMAQKKGLKVVISTKLRHGDANTVMAEGGIQAATQEGDSPYYHYLDVMGGGHFSNQPDLAAAMVNDAP
ncbi:MAG: FAD-binding protein, partial [Thermodesulfobacteriota bacterium]